jgi:hypothetical protein
MKNAVYWDIKTQFLPHRRHITSPLQNPAGQGYARFEVSTAMTMKNAVFRDTKPSSYLTGNTLSPLQNKQTKQTPWPLVRERTIPTERPPLVDEI